MKERNIKKEIKKHIYLQMQENTQFPQNIEKEKCNKFNQIDKRKVNKEK